jgi:hypothetical protein
MSTPADLVTVVSVRRLPAQAPGIHYVGRRCAGWRASALGNPHRVAADGRNAAIAAFRTWLWGEIRRGQAGEPSAAYAELCSLARQVAAGEPVVLGCWCKPAACHGDVVRSAVLWLLAEGGAA